MDYSGHPQDAPTMSGPCCDITTDDPFVTGRISGAPLVPRSGAKARMDLAVLSRALLRRGGLQLSLVPLLSVLLLARVCTARAFLRVVCPADVFNTEFLSPAVVQGQCAPGPTGAVFGGEPPGGVLAAAPVVVATPATAMNQLGTVYATKRRRRNGKRYV